MQNKIDSLEVEEIITSFKGDDMQEVARLIRAIADRIVAPEAERLLDNAGDDLCADYVYFAAGHATAAQLLHAAATQLER